MSLTLPTCTAAQRRRPRLRWAELRCTTMPWAGASPPHPRLRWGLGVGVACLLASTTSLRGTEHFCVRACVRACTPRGLELPHVLVVEGYDAPAPRQPWHLRTVCHPLVLLHSCLLQWKAYSGHSSLPLYNLITAAKRPMPEAETQAAKQAVVDACRRLYTRPDGTPSLMWRKVGSLGGPASTCGGYSRERLCSGLTSSDLLQAHCYASHT